MSLGRQKYAKLGDFEKLFDACARNDEAMM